MSEDLDPEGMAEQAAIEDGYRRTAAFLNELADDRAEHLASKDCEAQPLRVGEKAMVSAALALRMSGTSPMLLALTAAAEICRYREQVTALIQYGKTQRGMTRDAGAAMESMTERHEAEILDLVERIDRLEAQR